MPKTKKSVAGAPNPAPVSGGGMFAKFANEVDLSVCYRGNAVTYARLRLSNGAPRTVRDLYEALPECIASYRVVWGESPDDKLTAPRGAAKTVGGLLAAASAVAGKEIFGANVTIFVN